MNSRKWMVRITSHPWSHLLTLGIHIDLRHPLIEIHLGPFIISAGRFYRYEYGCNPSTTEWLTTHPDEDDPNSAIEDMVRWRTKIAEAYRVPVNYLYPQGKMPPEDERAFAEMVREKQPVSLAKIAVEAQREADADGANRTTGTENEEHPGHKLLKEIHRAMGGDKKKQTSQDALREELADIYGDEDAE